MSPKLQLIARRMNLPPLGEKAPAPADSSGLGAAIDQLIQERVDAALEQREKEQRHSPKVERLMRDFNAPEPVTDFKQLPPVPRTAPKKPFNLIVHRDGAGLILWTEETATGLKFEVIRDGSGKMIGAKQIDESPVLPALDIAHKAAARKYQPGEPRT